MPKELKITVSGNVNTGKSTVCYLIKKYFAEKGITVEFDCGLDYDNEKDFDVKISKNLNEKVEALSENVRVILKEVRTQSSISLPVLDKEIEARKEHIKTISKSRISVIFTLIVLIIGVPIAFFTNNPLVLFSFLFAGAFIGERYSYELPLH